MITNVFVFARGGSKGVPRKNIKLINGIPLIVYTLKLANRIPDVDNVFVSTDDKEIAKLAEIYSARVIERPKELSLDESPEWLAWQHAVEWVEKEIGLFDKFVSLPTTAPLRCLTDVQRCIRRLDDNADCIVSIARSKTSPWFNMVAKNEMGYIERLIGHGEHVIRRQDSPQAFDLTTVAYVTRPEFIKLAKGIFDGRLIGVEIPVERALDIDTQHDFHIAELLMSYDI